MANTISNKDDVIDSRDVIERIDWLGDELAEHADLYNAEELAELQAELKSLKALADEAEGYAADWPYGETLIRDSYFMEYAQELADSIGAIDNNASWPLTCIDWEQAARELQMDYTSVEFDGVWYWIR
jgi:hypothetical protein